MGAKKQGGAGNGVASLREAGDSKGIGYFFVAIVRATVMEAATKTSLSPFSAPHFPLSPVPAPSLLSGFSLTICTVLY